MVCLQLDYTLSRHLKCGLVLLVSSEYFDVGSTPPSKGAVNMLYGTFKTSPPSLVLWPNMIGLEDTARGNFPVSSAQAMIVNTVKSVSLCKSDLCYTVKVEALIHFFPLSHSSSLNLLHGISLQHIACILSDNVHDAD